MTELPEPQRPVARRVNRPDPLTDDFEEEVAVQEPEPRVPRVWICLRWMCLFVCIACIVVVMPIMDLMIHGNTSYSRSREIMNMTECVLGMIGISLAFAFYLVPMIFSQPKPWLWWYGLMVILLSLFTVYFTLFALPMLLFWVQPRTQHAFGRRMPVQPVRVA